MYPATSLQEKGYEVDRRILLRKYIEIYDKNYEKWQAEGFKSIRDKWLKNVKGLGEEIEVHMEKENKRGIFADIDETGALILEQGNKKEKIYAGDIFYIDKHR